MWPFIVTRSGGTDMFHRGGREFRAALKGSSASHLITAVALTSELLPSNPHNRRTQRSLADFGGDRISSS